MVGMAGTGFVLLGRADFGSRLFGSTLVAFALAGLATPALADQLIDVDDNARVHCTVAARELTRISLVNDSFASVSKTEASDPRDDFSVVNEPTRGDIYISLPSDFRPRTLSFFGTSKKGFVYKFACDVSRVEAQQVFLDNPAARVARAGAAKLDAEIDEDAPDQDEVAVRLIQAMAAQQMAPGFRLSRSTLAPVRLGDLSVQMISEYEGLDLVGRAIRIENLSSKPIELSEARVAPVGAQAVSIGNTKLAGRQATMAYVIVANLKRPQAGSVDRRDEGER